MSVLLIRLIAWLSDFCLSTVIFHYLLSFDGFVNFHNEISFQIKNYGVSVLTANFIADTVAIFLLTIIFRFYWTLLLGRSLSQSLLGLKSTSSFLWARVGGGLRCVLELAIPLSLADLPMLLRSKKTLKEYISVTELTFKPSLFIYPVSLIFIPFCLILSLSSPLLQNLTFIDGIKISFSKEKLEPIDNRTDFSKFTHYPSENFKMSSFSSIKESHLLLVPSFEITREKNKLRIRPYLVIHDEHRRVQGDLKLRQRLSLRKIIVIASEYNPLFSNFYPELSKILKRPRDFYGIKKYKNKFGDQKLLNPIARVELRGLIQSSFEISFKNLFSHVISNGPFISGHIKIRNLLLSLVDSDVEPEVDIVKLGNYNFLRFKQTFSELENLNKGMTETYIPVETLNSVVLEMNWGKSRKDAFTRNNFKKKFLSSSQWFFDYSKVFSPPLKYERFNAFTLLDYFTIKGLGTPFIRSLEKFSFNYLFDLSVIAMKNDDTLLKDSLIATSNRLLLLIKYRKSALTEDRYSQKFTRLISNLKEALVANNKPFFEITK
ncbi:hypothetical protein A9Q84_06385 [Halobacteriovorax marinus]|uniref:RDD domain-containing protein n=1 Tax=Halobacteriovorax marinus TaxID=97084 RepID=A0A1Y5FF92_9BACT|nr:hypothetical protein A9Q84_06385 [Halobacteriovorax marinus]